MRERNQERSPGAAEGQGSKKLGVSRRSRSKVDRVRNPEADWLTTADVARVLGIYRTGVHWLEAEGRLGCERTMSGQRLFSRTHVLAVAAERAEARLVPARRVIVGRYEHTQLRLPDPAPAAAERLRGVRLRMAKIGPSQAKESLDKCPVKARGIA